MGQFLVCTICGHGIDWEGPAMYSQTSDTTVSRCPCWRLACTRLKSDGTPVRWTYSELDGSSRSHRSFPMPYVKMERYEAWGCVRTMDAPETWRWETINDGDPRFVDMVEAEIARMIVGRVLNS